MDDNDPLWVEYRHRHIADVVPDLKNRFLNFAEENGVMNRKERDAKKMDVETVQKIMAGLPEYQQKMNYYSLHIKMTKKLMKRFKSQNLKVVGGFEQVSVYVYK